MKKCNIYILIIVLTASTTSVGWWYHVKSMVRSLTLVSLRDDINNDLNNLNKLKSANLTELRNDSEEHLALSTILLFNVLKDAGHNEKLEFQKTIKSLARYKFENTNMITSETINLLQQNTIQ